MKEELDKCDIFKFLDTEFVEHDSLVGDGYAGTLIPQHQKLTANNLVAFQVKCTESSLFNSLRARNAPYAVGNIVIGPRVVVYPMVVNGNKTPEDPLVNNMHQGETAANMVLSVLNEYLNSLELLHADNSSVLVLVKVLVAILAVFPVLVLVEISCKCFPSENVAAISFIGKDVADGSGVPAFPA